MAGNFRGALIGGTWAAKRFRHPLAIAGGAIVGGVVGEEGVELVIEITDEHTQMLVDEMKRRLHTPDIRRGSVPVATGSARSGRRSTIGAGHEENMLDTLAEENAQLGGDLFEDAIKEYFEQKQQEQENTPQADREISESARQQREQAPHASGESQVDSTGRRSRGPYDLDGPEAAAQEAPAAEVKAGSNTISDARETETPLQQGARHYVEIDAEEGLELGANLSAEGDGADQPLSYYDTQYGPQGNRASAYIHYMEEKEGAQQAEENERRAGHRAERALRSIPREARINATSWVNGVSS